MKTSDLIVVLTGLFETGRDTSTGAAADVYSEAIAMLTDSEVDYPTRGVLFLSDLLARVKDARFLSLNVWDRAKAWGIVEDAITRLHQRELATLRGAAA